MLRAGFCEVVITPPLGGRLSGYSARTGGAVAVLDDLYAKAMVLQADGDTVALVACDLIQVDRDLVAAIRQRVTAATGIGADAVMVAATHTHSGPALDQLEDATLDHLVAQVAGAVRAAAGALEPAGLGFASGRCDVGANRRFRESPFGPYFLYNDPAGLYDPTVEVMTVRGEGLEPLGVVMNYACHPVTLGHEELGISKDYVHEACEVLKGAWGREAAVLFLQGCAGNINPRWIWDRPDLSPPPERSFPRELPPRLREKARLGHTLGGEALKAAESVAAVRGNVRLGAATRQIDLPVRADLPEDVRNAAAQAPGRRYRTVMHSLARGARVVAAEIQVLRVGDALIVGLPGEIFVEYQIAIRDKLPGRPVFVVSMANDCVDYVATPQAFREGGYEPLVSYFAPETGDLLVEKALSAARDL